VYILKSALERAGTAAIKSDGTWDSDMMVVSLEQTNQVSTLATPFQFTPVDANNPHDVPYSPGVTTGIATQWVAGEQWAIWPNADYGDAYVAAGYDPKWKDVRYGGIHKWAVNPLLLNRLKAEVGTQPPVEEKKIEEEEAIEEGTGGAVATSFESATYTDPTYNFTVQYPKDWVARPDMMTTPYHVAVFSVDAFVPGIAMMAFDADAPESVDWIKNSVTLVKGTSPKVTGEIKETTTPDGSKAYEYKISYIASSGYAAEGWAKDVDRGAKRIRFMVYTVTEFEKFNDALFKEIANTATFK
jgi:hypothetical protein